MIVIDEIPGGGDSVFRDRWENAMTNEAAVQAAIRIEAGRLGILIWRNNRGAMEDTNGRIVRFGLGNDSPQVDRRLKSSDLVGQITTDYARPFARPVHIECKSPGWRFPDAWRNSTPDEIEKTRAPADAALRRTLAQWRWLKLHHDAGALAGFAQSVEDFHRILKGELVLP